MNKRSGIHFHSFYHTTAYIQSAHAITHRLSVCLSIPHTGQSVKNG